MEDYYMKLAESEQKMIIASFEDGGGTHCLGENTGLLSALLFDWLDEVFA